MSATKPDRPLKEGLKKLLLDFRTRLVNEEGFSACPWTPPLLSTVSLTRFIEWLDRIPDAQELLEEMGIEWVPKVGAS